MVVCCSCRRRACVCIHLLTTQLPFPRVSISCSLFALQRYGKAAPTRPQPGVISRQSTFWQPVFHDERAVCISVCLQRCPHTYTPTPTPTPTHIYIHTHLHPLSLSLSLSLSLFACSFFPCYVAVSLSLSLSGSLWLSLDPLICPPYVVSSVNLFAYTYIYISQSYRVLMCVNMCACMCVLVFVCVCTVISIAQAERCGVVTEGGVRGSFLPCTGIITLPRPSLQAGAD
jgi:hypothetical protein